MTVTVPLVVRLATANKDVHVTRELHSLSFRSVAPGGFASAQLELDRPLRVDAPEIQPLGRVYVYDGRNGATVWEGWMEDPGRGTGADGEVWKLSALGPSARAGDIVQPWIYIDKSLERMVRTPGAATEVTTSVEGSNTDDPSVRCYIPGGTAITGGNYFGYTYRGLQDTQQKVARWGASWQAYGPEPAGVDYFARGNTYTNTLPTSASDTNLNVQFTTGTNLTGPFIIGTHITAGRQAVAFFIGVGGGAHLAPAGMHISILNFYAMGTRYDRYGAEILTSSAYNVSAPNQLLSHQVVEDLLGRLLPTYDGATARIDTNTFGIDNMTYVDGATAQTIFDDLMALEPAFYWAAWESTVNGKSRFEWRPWPTTVRYEADVLDGYDGPGGASDLYNSVVLRWVDPLSRRRQTTRTQTVPLLAAVGVNRQALMDLGDNIGSDANAVQVGDGFLADHQVPANGGTLTVARSVGDNDTGRQVMPWEIRPGNLVRVRGIAGLVDSLNPSTRDGATVFRIAAVNYDTASAAATLELDTYPRSIAQALARLQKAQDRRRR